MSDASTAPETERNIKIREAETDPYAFFLEEVSGITPLDTDPFDRAWEAMIDGEVVGMLAIETFANPHLVRLAVRSEYRRQGVGTRLVERAKAAEDEWYAYVDEDNMACQQFLSSLGFERGGYAPPPNLEKWSWEQATADETERETA